MNQNQQRVLLAAVLCSLLAAKAFAGADTDFDEIVTTLQGWMEGSLGKVFALGSLAVGLGIGIPKQSVMAVVGGMGIGMAAFYGPTILAGMSSAALAL